MKECAAYGGVTEHSGMEAIYEHPQLIDNNCFAIQSGRLHTSTHTVATNCRFFFVAHVDNNLDTPLLTLAPACLHFQSILLQIIFPGLLSYAGTEAS